MGTRDYEQLFFKTSDDTRMVISEEGQFNIYSKVKGSDKDTTAYPLMLFDSPQGLYIEINEKRDEDNDFVTFADLTSGNKVQGRIEGEDRDELLNSFRYGFENLRFEVEIILSILEGGAGVTETFGIALATTDAATELWTGAKSALKFTTAAVKLAQIISFNVNKHKNLGVRYMSGATDYAEWLERGALERNLLAGEIVGVKGGIISLDTENADHHLVISTNPIVLGNEPAESDKANYEKVAFMG